ncbi:MAG: winged helix-turn-helix transcriptional regulator [Nitrosarchaeum sp.]|nr:winged helix-turn-helix transcriptional regulator [Nitrosarchaeum sp.]
MIRSDNRISTILEIIHNNPGIQFRELMKQSGMKNGVLSHYVNKIESRGMVKIERNPKQTKFFPLNITNSDQKIISALRKETPKKIILYLMSEGNKGVEFSAIPDKIGKSQSTVSFYLSQLVEDEIISIQIDNRQKKYFVKDRKSVDGLIESYHPGIVSSAADSFADTFNSL